MAKIWAIQGQPGWYEAEDILGNISQEPVEASAGTVMTVIASGTEWPDRPTDREDITVMYIGSDEANPPTDAVTGVDIWIRDLSL